MEKRVIQFVVAIVNGEYNDELMGQGLVPDIRGTISLGSRKVAW